MGRGSLLLAIVVLALPATTVAQTTERLYVDACSGGDATACNVFGAMLETGDGIERDPVRAAEMYRLACERGAFAGCSNLGLLFERGVGVSRDLARARGYHRVSCEGGERQGCAFLARLDAAIGIGAEVGYTRRGEVRDAATSGGLPGAVVALPELGIRRVTDATGGVDLGPLPSGRHAMTVAVVGYEAIEAVLEVPGRERFVILLAPVDESTGAGRLVGRVTDGAGSVMGNVEARVAEADAPGTLTDGEGRFVLSGVAPGPATVRFTRIGYAPRTATVVVHPGRTTELEVAMSSEAIELEPISVSVRPRYLETSGFYDRAARGFGRQFDREDMDDMLVFEVSDMLARLPGVRLSDTRMIGFQSVTAETTRIPSLQGPCVLSVYVDGVRQATPDLNLVPASFLEGMEVYVGLEAPARYRAANPCGVVLLWTRR